MRSEAREECHVCGEAGRELYSELKDKLFDAPGIWRLVQCQNTRCGLVWLNPMPLTEDLGAAYVTYYTHVKDSFPPDWPRKNSYRAFLQRQFSYSFGVESFLWSGFARLLPHRTAEIAFNVMYLPRHPGGRLLEVGCGGGAMLELMARLGWDAEGVDFDEKAVDVARSRGLRVRAGSLEQQGYPDNHFDAVTTSHLIEHVPDPRALLLEVRRILKPGGKLVIVTPNVRSWGHALFGRRWRGLEPPRHLHIFNRYALGALARECDLQIDQLRTTIRAANGMFNASFALGKPGARQVKAPRSKPWMVITRLMQFMEWGYLQLNRDAGEELVLVASKPLSKT